MFNIYDFEDVQCLWRGINGEEHLDSEHNEAHVFVNDRKKQLYELPVFENDLSVISEYEKSKDLALVLPVFDIGRPIYREVLCKNAMHLIAQLLGLTDIKDVGVPIYLHFSEVVYPQAAPYLDLCGLKDNPNVLTFSQEPLTKDRGTLQLKFESAFHSNLDDYEKVLWLDTDIEIYSSENHEKNPIFLKILSAWDSEFPILLPKIPYSKENASSIKRNMVYHGEDEWRKLAELTHRSALYAQNYWNSDDCHYHAYTWICGLQDATHG